MSSVDVSAPRGKPNAVKSSELKPRTTILGFRVSHVAICRTLRMVSFWGASPSSTGMFCCSATRMLVTNSSPSVAVLEKRCSVPTRRPRTTKDPPTGPCFTAKLSVESTREPYAMLLAFLSKIPSSRLLPGVGVSTPRSISAWRLRRYSMSRVRLPRGSIAASREIVINRSSQSSTTTAAGFFSSITDLTSAALGSDP